MAATDVRRYEVAARSTDVFGRVLCASRAHHFVVDGPTHNGCPGEELTPAELFLAGVASCGVELIQVLARQDGVPLRRVRSAISGELDPSRRARSDVTVFSRVRLHLELAGVTAAQGEVLVKGFKAR
jgi:organic hydroperoxide reductase OsmC/OhrA